jgi:glyoxylase-like metal-dependent hydrolase (beta-lactamase superfamily II)
MIRAIIAISFVLAGFFGKGSYGISPRFIKVSDHCYYLPLNDNGPNVGAVVTDDGVLMIDPPAEPDFSIALDALANLTSKTVRWIVFTEPGLSRNADSRFFAERNVLLLAGSGLQALSPPGPVFPYADGTAASAPSRLIFQKQIHLFPSDVEVRIIALQHKARTGGDMVVLVPAEKVLFVGGLYEAARYPDIEAAAGGSAADWMDGIKEVIDEVPVLKSAIPAAKPLTKQEEEKTLEEGITVISAQGEPSNLQNMKDLLEACKKLQHSIMRTVKAGRTCSSFLASSSTNPYRSYGNLDSYATQLFEVLEK